MNWTESQLAKHLERRGIPGAPNVADTSEPPFALPADVVLELPPPVSVNRARKIDWQGHQRLREWKRGADAHVFVAKRREVNPLVLARIPRFHLHIILDERLNDLDQDNCLKGLIDYLHQIGVVQNDAKKNMRRLVVDWGDAPTGCRVTVTPCA